MKRRSFIGACVAAVSGLFGCRAKKETLNNAHADWVDVYSWESHIYVDASRKRIVGCSVRADRHVWIASAVLSNSYWYVRVHPRSLGFLNVYLSVNEAAKRLVKQEKKRAGPKNTSGRV